MGWLEVPGGKMEIKTNVTIVEASIEEIKDILREPMSLAGYDVDEYYYEYEHRYLSVESAYNLDDQTDYTFKEQLDDDLKYIKKYSY